MSVWRKESVQPAAQSTGKLSQCFSEGESDGE